MTDKPWLIVFKKKIEDGDILNEIIDPATNNVTKIIEIDIDDLAMHPELKGHDEVHVTMNADGDIISAEPHDSGDSNESVEDNTGLT